MSGVNHPPLQLGFVGCGRATSTLHLPALQGVAEVDVASLADADPERLNTVADRFGIAGRFSGYKELLADPAIDAVAVCVPPPLHAEIALAVLDADKHLFVEKPLALSLADCDRIIEGASRSGRRAQIGLNLRQHRLVREARQVIQQGDLGELELVRSIFSSATRLRGEVPGWRQARDTGGDVLLEVATHHFDLWRFLTGSDVERIFVSRRPGRAAEQSASISARMTDGTLVSAAFTENTGGSNEIEILSSEGLLRVNLYRFDGISRTGAFQHGGDLALRLQHLFRSAATFPRGLSIMRRGGDYLMSYQRQWRRFAAAVFEGGPIDATLEDGRAAAAVSLAALRSADEGQAVEVAAPPAGPEQTKRRSAPAGGALEPRQEQQE